MSSYRLKFFFNLNTAKIFIADKLIEFQEQLLRIVI